MLNILCNDLGFILIDIIALIFLFYFLKVVIRNSKTGEKRHQLMQKAEKLKAKLDAIDFN